MKKPRKGTLSLNNSCEREPIPIVGNGAIASGEVSLGKLIPALIIDASSRPDVRELFRVHEHLAPGDVTSQWISVKGNTETFYLLLTFTRPSQLNLLLAFDISSPLAALGDLIHKAQALYLRLGQPGDSMADTTGSPQLLIEVPNGGFEHQWREMRLKALERSFRDRGLSKKGAKEAASKFMTEWDKLGDSRVPDQG